MNHQRPVFPVLMPIQSLPQSCRTPPLRRLSFWAAVGIPARGAPLRLRPPNKNRRPLRDGELFYGLVERIRQRFAPGTVHPLRRSSLVGACKPLPTVRGRHLTLRNYGLTSLPPMSLECELLILGTADRPMFRRGKGPDQRVPDWSENRANAGVVCRIWSCPSYPRWGRNLVSTLMSFVHYLP